MLSSQKLFDFEEVFLGGGWFYGSFKTGNLNFPIKFTPIDITQPTP